MIYFVTEEFIKNKTHITQNVDASDIAPFLQIAAVTYVQPILGYTFYNHLLKAYNDGTTTPNEDILIEFISYVVAFSAAYEALPNLAWRISNKGPQSQFGDYSAAEGIEVVNYLRRNIIKFSNLKTDELRAYLSENKKLFPQWSEKENNSIVKPDKRRKNNPGGLSTI